MEKYNSNQDFYNHIDEFVVRLDQSNYAGYAKKLHHRLHDVAWTTTSELFGELKEIFKELLVTQPAVSKEMQNDLKHFISTIDKAWEQANSG